MSAHTPGPWNVGGEWPEVVAIYHDSVFIAHAETGEHGSWIGTNPIGRKRAMANARLIAAAPEMLTVLKHWIGLVDGGPMGTVSATEHLDRLHAAARAAIAKAEGSAS